VRLKENQLRIKLRITKRALNMAVNLNLKPNPGVLPFTFSDMTSFLPST
jgi:hypothetical protein